MNRIALNIICKNESKAIGKLLDSIVGFVDLVTAVDTGSTDSTIALIQNFGKQHHLPTYVFERPFDNFCNSRNYALDKLHEVIAGLGWPADTVWGFTIDCDEYLEGGAAFDKRLLRDDIHQIVIQEEAMMFKRQALFKLSRPFRWESPLHEILVCPEKDLIISTFDQLKVVCLHVGASWKANLEKKFLRYGGILERYLLEGHSDTRTLLNLGASYQDAAMNCKSKERRRGYFVKARHIYETALAQPEIVPFYKSTLLMGAASHRQVLGEDWGETEELYLEAYSLNINKPDAIEPIISHYIEERKWALAYFFSHVALKRFDGMRPRLSGGDRVALPLYFWKLLVYHTTCAHFLGYAQIAAAGRGELQRRKREHPEWFSPADHVFLARHSPFVLRLMKWKKSKRG